MTTSLTQRIAGAPISWGVCEAPDWGYELAPDRVLREMRSLEITATELGTTGYLGTDPTELRATLGRYGMTLIGGFLPVILHVDPAQDYTAAEAAMATLAAAGSTVVVLAAQSADGSYDRKVSLDQREWETLLSNLQRVEDIARRHGLLPTLHPHVGTAIESRESVLRLLEFSSIKLCLDTGHLVIGGMDPLELLELAADRVAHVHLKDIRLNVAATVSAGDTPYIEAVRAGLYAPLGSGDLAIARIVNALEDAGYPGWYVLEQDCALFTEPPPGAGPILDMASSVSVLNTVATSLNSRTTSAS